MTISDIEIEFLEISKIEERAEEILEKAQNMGLYNSNGATNIDLITEALLGLVIVFEDLDTHMEGALGILDVKNGKIIIDQNLDNSLGGESFEEGRLNFTIAHEIGHFVLHRDKFSEENCLFFHNELNPIVKRAEFQANAFASAFLMPRKLFIKKWNQELDKTKSPNEAKLALVEFFKTSREATQIRLQNLSLI